MSRVTQLFLKRWEKEECEMRREGVNEIVREKQLNFRER
jgi:hypothetical protein